MEGRLSEGILGIDTEPWDRLVPTADPFVRHAFLGLLERSGSVGPGTGWQPLHAVVEEAGEIVAAAPLYAKGHSWGEYVFDHGWADALERAGGRYYPKLQVAVPFTPVPGPRLLAPPGPAREALIRLLADLPERLGLSSLHVTFCTAEETELLAEAGFLIRQGVQYHWHNRGYRDFQDFLDSLRSQKKKMIRKEREAVRAAGIEIEVLHGAALDEATLAGFYPFYLATVDKRWGSAYLTEAFFAGLGRNLGQHVVYVVARHAGKVVGAALNLWGGGALYGRIWGSLEEFPFLHFECCYYAAIEFAIRHGIERVEAGAQGPHKILRGYEPVPTWSAHAIRDTGFRNAVARFLKQERSAMARDIEEKRGLLPYRRED
jgi:predicted N-acyltransferase